MNFNLTMPERQILFRKYKDNGLDYYAADAKVKEIASFLREFGKKLKDSKKSQKEINIKFKIEFAKLIGDRR